MPNDQSPTLSRWELGGSLRRIREERGQTIEQVAEDLSAQFGAGFSAAKIGRLETGQRGANPRDVRDLCEYYGVDAAERDRLVAMARSVRQTRTQPVSATYAEFVALESIARTVRVFEPVFVPGLLQTPEYFRALFESEARAGVRPEAVAGGFELRAETRRKRQARLSGDNPVNYKAIIDENVIRRRVGPPQLMAEQLKKLIELSRQPNILIRVIPITIGIYPGCESSGFTLLEYDQSENLKDNACYIEGIADALWAEQAAARQHVASIFSYMEEIALDADLSRALMDEARRSILEAAPEVQAETPKLSASGGVDH